MMARRGMPVDAGGDGRSSISARWPAIPRSPTTTTLPFGSHRREGAAAAARRRAHRRGGDLHDDRAAVGGRARRRRAVAGLHPRLQPLDLRMVLRQRRPSGPGGAPVARRSRRPPPRSWSAQSAKARAACTSRRSRTRAKPLGHPDHDVVFAAAQDHDIPFAIHPTFEPQWTKGSAHGRVGERARAPAHRVGAGVRRRAPSVLDALRLRRLRPLPAAEDPRARVGRRLDRLLARPHGRRLRPHRASASGCRSRTRPRTTSGSGAGSAAIPTSGRSRRWPSGSAPIGSCGRRDFPHADHTPEYIHDLDELAGMFPDESRRKFLGDNCRELFKIDV